MNMMTVQFHSAELPLINHNGQPYVAMKPIVEGMGLAWQGQYDKLKQRFSSTIMEIMMVAQDGKQRAMICLPLRKLFGWLMTISPNKVKPEIRDTVIQYQNECDDVLWEYWSNKRKTAFDEYNKLCFEESISKMKGTFHGLGLYQRKVQKQRNQNKMQQMESTMQLSFSEVKPWIC